jgi:hypothetical protein
MRVISCLCVAVCLAACGASRGGEPVHRAPSPVARAEMAHEYPAPAPPPESAAGRSPSAAAAVTAFAAAYINWNAHTISADLRALAGRSIDQARSAMQLAAAQTASDYELQRGGIANQGTVEAVAPLRGGGNQFVVVTRELTSATATTAYQGLQPAWHIALATVTEERPGQWVVSAWQPES